MYVYIYIYMICVSPNMSCRPTKTKLKAAQLLETRKEVRKAGRPVERS